MLRGYEFRIYPTEKQKGQIAQHFGCARLAYNLSLSKTMEHYTNTGKHLSGFQCNNYFTNLKKTEEYTFLKEVQSSVITNAIFDLQTAYTKFFREKSGFPKFKSRKSHRHSFTMHQTSGVCKLDYENNKVWIPRIKWLDCRLSRKVEGNIKSITVKQVPSGKYFISILVEDNKTYPPKKEIVPETTIGIDLGLKTFATLSNGIKLENIRPLKNEEKKLKVLQKRMSKRVKGSKNYEKARIKVARQHEHIANIRKDYLHKVSTNIINDSQVDTICLETLNIKGMMKNHKLAKAISDVSLGMFKKMLEYKADWKGKNIIYIGQFEPSTKLCHVCGFINNNITLSDREWECPSCNTYHDRDINASINIKQIALSDYNKKYINSGLGQSVELVEVLALAEPMKQEKLKNS